MFNSSSYQWNDTKYQDFFTKNSTSTCRSILSLAVQLSIFSLATLNLCLNILIEWKFCTLNLGRFAFRFGAALLFTHVLQTLYYNKIYTINCCCNNCQQSRVWRCTNFLFLFLQPYRHLIHDLCLNSFNFNSLSNNCGESFDATKSGLQNCKINENIHSWISPITRRFDVFLSRSQLQTFITGCVLIGTISTSSNLVYETELDVEVIIELEYVILVCLFVKLLILLETTMIISLNWYYMYDIRSHTTAAWIKACDVLRLGLTFVTLFYCVIGIWNDYSYNYKYDKNEYIFDPSNLIIFKGNNNNNNNDNDNDNGIEGLYILLGLYLIPFLVITTVKTIDSMFFVHEALYDIIMDIQSTIVFIICWILYWCVFLPLAGILCYILSGGWISIYYETDSIQFLRHILKPHKWCNSNMPNTVFENINWNGYYKLMNKIWYYLIYDVKISNNLIFNQQIGCINYHILKFCVNKVKLQQQTEKQEKLKKLKKQEKLEKQKEENEKAENLKQHNQQQQQQQHEYEQPQLHNRNSYSHSYSQNNQINDYEHKTDVIEQIDQKIQNKVTVSNHIDIDMGDNDNEMKELEQTHLNGTMDNEKVDIDCDINININLNVAIENKKKKSLENTPEKDINIEPETSAEKFFYMLQESEKKHLMANVTKDVLKGKNIKEEKILVLIKIFANYVYNELKYETCEVFWDTPCIFLPIFIIFYGITRFNLTLFPIYAFFFIIDIDKIVQLGNLKEKDMFVEYSIGIFELFYFGYLCLLLIGYCSIIFVFIKIIIPLYYKRMFILSINMFIDEQDQKEVIFKQFEHLSNQQEKFLFESIVLHCKALEWRPSKIKWLNQQFGDDIASVIQQYLPVNDLITCSMDIDKDRFHLGLLLNF